MDALLYLPGHTLDQVERALRIPALSIGWQTSLQAMLQQMSTGKTLEGNPGLASEEQAPAWPGFRQMRVAHRRKESDSVTSFILVPLQGGPLPVAQPGQFVVLRFQVDPDNPPVLRSYSLSDLPGVDHFRISVKSEGVGSSFLCNRVREGDLLDVSAPRGNFTLRPGSNPVVLLSAGVGATPVMAMLHVLATERSERQVWWIYGTRNGGAHPFAEESRSLLEKLAGGRGYVVYSKPTATDQVGVGFDASGHINVDLLDRLDVPRNSHFYLCGPASFLQNMREGLRSWGVLAENVRTEIFGALDPITPGMAQRPHTPHALKGSLASGPSVSFARSGITVAWDPKFQSLLELAEACDVPVRWSCRTGVCHTCMTGMIGGSITYAPEPLERPAPGNVLVCCSQPKTNVIIDL
jgi:ferredoxin-NADP reductase